MLNAIAFSFLKASITCGIAAAVILALLTLATRVWPVLAGHRSVWLWSQTAIACAFVVALLPHSAAYSVVPAIEIARPVAQAAQASVQPGWDASEADGLDDDIDPLELLAQAWLALYVAGLLAACARWVHAQRGLRATASSPHSWRRAGRPCSGAAAQNRRSSIRPPCSPTDSARPAPLCIA